MHLVDTNLFKNIIYLVIKRVIAWYTCGLSARGTLGSLPSQAQSGRAQLLGSQGEGSTPSSGLHFLAYAQHASPRRISSTTNRAIVKNGTDVKNILKVPSSTFLERNWLLRLIFIRTAQTFCKRHLRKITSLNNPPGLKINAE